MISTRKNGLICALFLIFCTGAHADLPSGSFRDVKPVSGLENPWRDQAPTLVDDGLTIYFSSNRPTATNPGGGGGAGYLDSDSGIDRRSLWGTYQSRVAGQSS